MKRASAEERLAEIRRIIDKALDECLFERRPKANEIELSCEETGRIYRLSAPVRKGRKRR